MRVRVRDARAHAKHMCRSALCIAAFSTMIVVVAVRDFRGRLFPRGACRLVVVPGGQQSSKVCDESSLGKPIYVPKLSD